MSANLYRFGLGWCLNTGLRATIWRTAKDARLYAETLMNPTDNLLSLHAALQKAFYRLEMLDSNGASATASDIQDWVDSGELAASDAARFTDEINAACDALEKEGN